MQTSIEAMKVRQATGMYVDLRVGAAKGLDGCVGRVDAFQRVKDVYGLAAAQYAQAQCGEDSK